MKIPSKRKIIVLSSTTLGIVAFGFMVIFPLLLQKTASATTTGFNAGKIIDDGVFTNAGTMNTGAIQDFLNSKISSCDTNGTQPASDFGRPDLTHAQYAASKGWSSPPYACLKDYSEGGRSAAQIIYDTAQQYTINPQVLIVLLQKEQGLVTDTWPLSSQYKTATGYGCPDTAACDSTYFGFTNQITWAGKMYRAILNQSSTWYSPYVVGSNYIQWNPNASCGGSTVNIQNLSTAALYDYTPYQPNQAALNAGYGAGDSCSSNGNRNFYAYFTDWFGSTYTSIPYAWRLVGQASYADSGHSTPLNDGTIVAPGQTIYLQIKAQNVGYQTWQNSIVKLGTSNPTDHPSAFADSSWTSSARIAMTESSVVPGTIGTFNFSITAPLQAAGTYREYFDPLAENVTWMNDLGLYFTINVIPRASPQGSDAQLTSGQQITVGNYILSADKHSTLALQGDGNVVLYSNFTPKWWSGTNGTQNINRLVMQSDGNLVLYDKSNAPIWNSRTSGNSGAYARLQTDGNLVIYSSGGVPLWNSKTDDHPDYLGRVTEALPISDLYPGQSLETTDRKYKFVLQGDGNLVLYSANHPIWASSTIGSNATRLSMQADGNLVLYDANGTALWYSQTVGGGTSYVAIQNDGNVVIYNNNGARWSTNTRGL
jgi:hypothetical protein